MTRRDASLAISTDEVEIAWAAGLFEGEGWLSMSHTRPGDKVPHANLGLSSTDEDVIRRFAGIIGGRVTGPHEKKGAWNFKTYWHCQVSRHDDIGTVLAAFWPWLGERRRARCEEVREATHAFFGTKGPKRRAWPLRNKGPWEPWRNEKDMNEDHWWETYGNVVMLAEWMRDRDYGVDDVVAMVAKPWKFTAEYEEAVEAYEAEMAAEEATEAENAEEVEEVVEPLRRLEQEFKAGFDEVRPPQ